MGAGPLAPDHDSIVASGGAYAHHPASTAVNGDPRAAGTLTNGGVTRAFGLTSRRGRGIAGRARRRAALLRTASGRGATFAVATFAVTSAAALACACTGSRRRSGILCLRELDAASSRRWRNAGCDTHRSSHTE